MVKEVLEGYCTFCLKEVKSDRMLLHRCMSADLKKHINQLQETIKKAGIITGKDAEKFLAEMKKNETIHSPEKEKHLNYCRELYKKSNFKVKQ